MPSIFNAAGDAVRHASNKLMPFVDLEQGFRYLIQAMSDGRLVVVDEEFAILFEVGSIWYSRAPVLVEELVLRIHPGDVSSSVIPPALEALAAQHNCRLVIAGDSQIGIMAARYSAAGFSPLAQQFIKVM